MSYGSLHFPMAFTHGFPMALRASRQLASAALAAVSKGHHLAVTGLLSEHLA